MKIFSFFLTILSAQSVFAAGGPPPSHHPGVPHTTIHFEENRNNGVHFMPMQGPMINQTPIPTSGIPGMTAPAYHPIPANTYLYGGAVWNYEDGFALYPSEKADWDRTDANYKKAVLTYDKTKIEASIRELTHMREEFGKPISRDSAGYQGDRTRGRSEFKPDIAIDTRLDLLEKRLAVINYADRPPDNPCKGCSNQNCNEEFASRKGVAAASRLNPCVCNGEGCQRMLARRLTKSVLEHQKAHKHIVPIQKVSRVINPSRIPDPERVPHDFRSSPGVFRDSVERLYKDLYKISPEGKVRQDARQFGLIATSESDKAFSLGHQRDASLYFNMGKDFLDIAVGLDPVTGFARSTYELFTGKNMITGHDLSKLDRSLAFLGVMSAGTTSFVPHTANVIQKIYGSAGKLVRNKDGFNAAVREGKRLASKVEPLLQRMFKKHHITSIETAEKMNQEYLRRGWRAVHEHGTHVVRYDTTANSKWARLHGPDNREGRFVLRYNSIKGLTIQEARIKYALPENITHISDVHVPKGTPMNRSNIQYHNFNGLPDTGRNGAIQYVLEKDIDPNRFRNTRAIGERFE